MSHNFDSTSLWAVLRVEDEFFATPCEQVRSIIALTGVTPVPHLPKYMRGVINHQGEVIHVLEMRSRLGLKSLSAEVNEFVGLMEDREQDHVHWIDTLVESVQEKKKFTLTTDPHRCKFGQWYDHFLPKTEDVLLKSLLSQFDKPHQSVHGVAIQVEKLQYEGHYTEAFELIQDRKDHELRIMRNLFSDVKETYRNHNREIAVVLEFNNRLAALVIDEVIAIEPLLWDNWQTMDEATGGRVEANYMLGVAEIPEKELPVVVLDVSRCFA
jgi:purine-binding chemotaxis protein CheW